MDYVVARIPKETFDSIKERTASHLQYLQGVLFSAQKEVDALTKQLTEAQQAAATVGIVSPTQDVVARWPEGIECGTTQFCFRIPHWRLEVAKQAWSSHELFYVDCERKGYVSKIEFDDNVEKDGFKVWLDPRYVL